MYRPTILLLCSVMAFGVLVFGCRWSGPPVNNDNSSPRPTPTSTATKAPSESTVTRVDANVMAGDSAPPPTLTDNDPHDLLPRTQVLTDPNGEALLELAGCTAAYLFQKSGMTYDGCSRSERKSGNAACLQGGTAVFNSECAGRIEQIIETPTGEIKPTGTWFSVTYIPEQQLTVTLVMKGSVEVRPVIDMESRKLGEPTVISAGQSSAVITLKPGAEDFGQIADLQRPKPFSEMPDWVKATLAPWLDRIKKHADADGVAFNRDAFTSQQDSPIDCDCGHVDFGLLTRQYRAECMKAQQVLIEEYRRTGKVTGTCNSVAQGPNARPKG